MLAEFTRRESNEKTDKKVRQQMILDAWDCVMTAREIKERLILRCKLSMFSDMNAVRPRITELVREGKLIECGMKPDKLTGRSVTMWRKP